MSDRNLEKQGRLDYRMLTDGQPITAEDRDALLSNFESWRLATDRQVSLKDAAARVGVSASVLSEVLSGRYRGDTDQVLRLIDSFLAEEEQRSSRHDVAAFAALVKLTNEIFGAIKTGIQLNKCPVIIGPPGCGKSKHALAFAAQRPQTYLLTIPERNTGATAVSQLLCDVLTDHRGQRGSLAMVRAQPHARRMHAVREFFSRRRNAVLIVDEAQNLVETGLELLRGLHDSTDPAGQRCMPVVFLGDERFFALLGETKSGRRTRITGQLARRMYPILNLQDLADDDGGAFYTVEDILRLSRNSQLKLLRPDSARWLTLLANSATYEGLISVAVTVLRAAMLYYAEARPFTPEHLQQAFVLSVGRRTAQEIDQRAGGALLRRTA
ncbi:MAG: AAA family ATPase [Phycisphaerae bacterium]|nr:AAA family ATPase [Phycisphaerae bacterium]MCZ2398615.1 AAA family ATPase [Phycisphaerae bacterium]